MSNNEEVKTVEPVDYHYFDFSNFSDAALNYSKAEIFTEIEKYQNTIRSSVTVESSPSAEEQQYLLSGHLCFLLKMYRMLAAELNNRKK